MTSPLPTPPASRLAAPLRWAGWFMLGVGAAVLALGALGAGGEPIGGVLVLAGASVLLPAEERGAKRASAAASVALAVLSWVA